MDLFVASQWSRRDLNASDRSPDDHKRDLERAEARGSRNHAVVLGWTHVSGDVPKDLADRALGVVAGLDGARVLGVSGDTRQSPDAGGRSPHD
jgi:hypothetical protein